MVPPTGHLVVAVDRGDVLEVLAIAVFVDIGVEGLEGAGPARSAIQAGTTFSES